MLAEENLLPKTHCDGIFEMPTIRDHRRQRFWQFNGERRIATRPPQDNRLSGDYPYHRIIHWTANGTVMNQEKISDSIQPDERFPLINANRFAGKIPARRHNRK